MVSLLSFSSFVPKPRPRPVKIKEGNIIYLIILTISLRKAFSYSHSVLLYAYAVLDKLFMGSFPHNFASTCFPSFNIHAEGDYVKKLRCYGSLRRIIQLSYFCGADDIQYAPKILRCFLSLSSLWWLSGQFISLPWLLCYDYIFRDGFIFGAAVKRTRGKSCI